MMLQEVVLNKQTKMISRAVDADRKERGRMDVDKASSIEMVLTFMVLSPD